MPIRKISKLEETIKYLGQSPSEGGALFVDLCALLLKTMGFTDIYKRKGTEAGRDIDAKFSGQIWYFECKRYSKQIDTPEMAYKFLQLEILPDELQPDFFVLMSNASMKSILKDIVEFKKVDQKVKYSVEAWINESLDPIFDNILLSYPEVYINFLRQNIKRKGKEFERLVSDFQYRSELYLREKPAFFNGLLNSIAIIKQAVFKKPVESSAKFILEHTYKVTRRSNVGSSWSLVLVGCPQHPVSGLYNFNDFQVLSTLCNTLSRWGLQLPKRINDCIVFHEIGTKTLFFDYGAIVTVTPLSYMDGMEPWEWLQPLREDCIRMRNFAKKGMLITPAIFKAYITNLWASPEMELHMEAGYFGTMDRFLPAIAPLNSDKGYIQIPALGVYSEEVAFSEPPNMHDEIGRPLALSLWKNAGINIPFYQAAEETEHKLMEELKRLDSIKSSEAKKDYSTTFSYSVEFFRSLMWLREGELFDRSYDVFEEMLKEQQPKK